MTAPLSLADLGRRLERLDVAEAQRDAAVELVRDLAVMVAKEGGYRTPKQLEIIWRAHALLTELGVEYR